MLRYLVPAVVACLLLGNDPIPNWGETTDAGNLHGTWYGVSIEDSYGDKVDDLKAVLIFENNGNFTLKRRGKIILQGTFTTDTSKEPKTIDLTITGPDASVREQYKGKVLGVYQLERDTLKWCHADPVLQPGPRGHLPARPPKITPTNIGECCFTFKRLPP